MEIVRGISDFDENGNLPFKIYRCTLDEFENKFVVGLSEKRLKIMDYYKKHLDSIKNCDYTLNHWIDGSFVSNKENPNDIDTLTELDGVKCDNSKENIQKFFDESSITSNGYCHSFCIFKYPEEDKEAYDLYVFFINYKRYFKLHIKSSCLFIEK